MNNPENIPEVIRFQPDGTGAGLYTEAIDLKEIGILDVSRASNIEFDLRLQHWEVSDFLGSVIFTHPSREECLRWERIHFDESITH